MFGLLGARAAQFGGGAPAPIDDFIQNGSFAGVSPWQLNGVAEIANGRMTALDDEYLAPARNPLKRSITPADGGLSLLVNLPVVPGGASLRIELYDANGDTTQQLYWASPAPGLIALNVTPDSVYTHLQFAFGGIGLQIDSVQLLP